VLVQERLHFLQGCLALRGVRQARLKDVRHPVVQVELDRAAGLVDRLVKPDEVAQEDLLGPALDQRRRESLGEVGIERGAIGCFWSFGSA
jgi:hypothetical protein